MKEAALLCASGIGDGLLMMIGAHHLKLAGYRPTIFHNAAKELSLLFETHNFASHLPLEDLETKLAKYERVIIENDNSARAWHLFRLRKKGKLRHITFFFPTSSKNREEGDFVFNPKLPIASNLSLVCQKMLGTYHTKENDLTLPQNKTFRKHLKRVIIHPTSNDPKRNWKKDQFLCLGNRLEQKGFSIVFCVGPNERKEWEAIKGISLFQFKNLRELKDYIYESGYLIGNDSGFGHLASNLGVPTLTISGNRRRVCLWRPDWSLGKIVTPSLFLPNFRGLNLAFRETFWQNFVSVSRVYHTFIELVNESGSYLF